MNAHLRRICLLLLLAPFAVLTASAQEEPAPTAPMPDARSQERAEALARARAEERNNRRSTSITPANKQQPYRPVEPTVSDPDEMVGLVVFSDMGAPQVLDMLEQWTNKIILRRQDIGAVKINFNSRGELTKGEAILATESLLTLNGIMLTDMGGRFMKAVPATEVNRHVPEMLLGSTLDLPPSQQIYAKLFKFEYLQAENASASTVAPLLSQNSSFVAFPKANALLITDALINLQRIEEIINEMDHPLAVREEIKFIKLNYVQADEMQKRIEALIQGPLKNYLEGNTSVAADERTNQLILVTHPGNLDLIMDVIANIDVDAAPLTSTEIFPLRQAQAADVVTIIEQIISGQKEGREEDAKVTRDTSTPPTTPGAPTPNAAPTRTATTTSTTTSAANGSLQFSTFVGLTADERTNAIVAYGTRSDLSTLKTLIDQIDRPLPQVRIEAIITQVLLRETENRGIDSFELDYNLDNSNEINSAVGTKAGSSAAVSLKDFSLDLVLGVAESKSNVRVLSTPVIVVSHNQEATINVSESRPIVTSSTSSLDSNNNTRSTVEYRDIGINLTVTPLIGSDGTVQLDIEQLIEDVVGEVEVDGNLQPIIGKREANSYLTVRDRDVIVLGGLQENRQKIGDTSLEGLGDLPLIGGLFHGKAHEYQRAEIIIFIQATILTSPADAAADTQEQLARSIEVTPLRRYIKTADLGDTYVENSAIPTDIEARKEAEIEKKTKAAAEAEKVKAAEEKAEKKAANAEAKVAKKAAAQQAREESPQREKRTSTRIGTR